MNRPWRRRLLAAALALSTGACAAPVALPPRDLPGELDRFGAALVEERRFPGLSIAVLEGDRIIYSGAHGLARLESPSPVGRGTPFDLGSISKSFAASATMTLVERGALGLDDPVLPLVPELGASGEAVRLRHLLAQTAGLPELFKLPGYESLAARPGGWSLAAAMEEIARAPRLFEPGSHWSYSNSNYAAIALVVERVAGVPYGRYLAEQVLGPAGLAGVRACAEIPAGEPGFAALYRVGASGAFEPVVLDAYRHTYIGFGELCGTAEEVARFFRALASGRIVAPTSFAKMSAATPVEVGGLAPYGFGLSVKPIVGQEAIAHTGSSGTAAAYFPRTATTIVVLTNRDVSFAESALQEVARRLWDLPEPPPPEAKPPIPAEVARFTGLFDDGLFQFEVTFSEGALWLDNPPFGAKRRLAREREGRFVSVNEPQAIALELADPEANPGVDLLFDWAGLRSFARRLPAPAPGAAESAR